MLINHDHLLCVFITIFVYCSIGHYNQPRFQGFDRRATNKTHPTRLSRIIFSTFVMQGINRLLRRARQAPGDATSHIWPHHTVCFFMALVEVHDLDGATSKINIPIHCFVGVYYCEMQHNACSTCSVQRKYRKWAREYRSFGCDGHERLQSDQGCTSMLWVLKSAVPIVVKSF